jgi:glycosyltransferase involved in cell wall biosynthesis
MKVLILTPWYPDSKNRVHGIFVREQAQAIATQHEVCVISSKIDYHKFGICKSSIKGNVSGTLIEFRLRIHRSLAIYNQLNYFIVSALVAKKIARSFKPDVIHGTIGYPGGFWSWIVSRWLRKPYIITEHTFIKNNFRSFFHKKLTLFSLKNASVVITVSNKAAHEIRNIINREIEVIPNIIDFSRFSVSPFRQGIPVIGFLGGLISESHTKGLDVLLNLLSRIRSDFTLIVGGDGRMLEKYIEQATRLGINGKCRFVGFVPYEEVPSFMNQLHFFVNTSRHESFGIALVEAISSGVPVISFDNGGPSEFVNASNGILVENQNERRFMESIDWMISHYRDFDRDQMRESIRNRFSSSTFLTKMNSVYAKVVPYLNGIVKPD